MHIYLCNKVTVVERDVNCNMFSTENSNRVLFIISLRFEMRLRFTLIVSYAIDLQLNDLINQGKITLNKKSHLLCKNKKTVRLQ